MTATAKAAPTTLIPTEAPAGAKTPNGVPSGSRVESPEPQQALVQAVVAAVRATQGGGGRHNVAAVVIAALALAAFLGHEALGNRTLDGRVRALERNQRALLDIHTEDAAWTQVVLEQIARNVVPHVQLPPRPDQRSSSREIRYRLGQ